MAKADANPGCPSRVTVGLVSCPGLRSGGGPPVRSEVFSQRSTRSVVVAGESRMKKAAVVVLAVGLLGISLGFVGVLNAQAG